MSLSKKNLDKLKNFIKNEKFIEDGKIINTKYIDKIPKVTNNQSKLEDPNKIFYSLIDNSESLDETSEVSHLLRNSETNQINIDTKKVDYSKCLSAEDKLYDEFNYLLEE